MADNRKRNFACIIYEEWYPNDDDKLKLLQILLNLKVPCALSPLHDNDFEFDVNTGAFGDKKKAHYHLLIALEGKQNVDTVYQWLVDAGIPLTSTNSLEFVKSLTGMTRYLCHLDVPEEMQAYKPKYDTSDVKTFGGFNFYDLIKSDSSRNEAVKDMINYIRKNNVISWHKFFEMCADHNDCWFNFLNSGSQFVIRSYIVSRADAQERKF